MRRTAWMLLLSCVVGCGASSNPGTSTRSQATKDTPVSEALIPVEVETLFNKGEFAQSIETLTSMITKSPSDENLYSLRASAHHRLGHRDQAIQDIRRAIEFNPRDAKLYNNRGFMRLGMEQFQAAQDDFDKAIELAPRYKNAFNNRGLLCIALHHFEDAIAAFNRAIEIDNQYFDAYNNRGFAELELGQIAKALGDFNVVIQLNPNYVNGYTNRGLLRAQAGDYENAVLDFTQAMILDPLNPKYYEHRRDVYRKQGEYRREIEDDKKILWLVEYHQLSAEIAASTNPVNELIERAQHFILANNDDKALQDLNRALEFDSQAALALITRAGVYLRRRALQDAKADATAAIAIAPTDEAYSMLGDVFLDLGDYDRAIESYARARRTDEIVAEAYYGNAKRLETDGQSELAKNNLERALALDPDIERRLR